MKRDMRLYLVDIMDSIERIEEYTQAITGEDFFKDVKIQDAVMRRLEIIGEAVKNTPLDFKNKYPAVPWKRIAGLRDILIHEYFGVNLKRVWKIIKEDLPELKKQISEILEKIEEETE